MSSLQAPASEQPLFAVCYDVSDDRERRHVDRTLQGFGFRVQRSVFECRMTPGALRKLRHQLDQLGLKTGFVRLYRVLGTAPAGTVGKAPPHPDEAHAYVVASPDRPPAA